MKCEINKNNLEIKTNLFLETSNKKYLIKLDHRLIE